MSSSILLFGQEESRYAPYSKFITPEFFLVKTIPPNEFFPEFSLGKSYFLSFGRFYDTNDPEWAYRLNYPRTGISIGVTDFGNLRNIGYSYTFMPFTEFNLFGMNNLKTYLGMGGSFFTKKYNEKNNKENAAITTNYTWSFRFALQYSLLKNKDTEWNVGIGLLHHSNGHTRLPNIGLNSVLVSTSVQINYSKNKSINTKNVNEKPTYKRSSQYFFSLRQGLGINVLSEEFNQKKSIYATALSFGKIYNKTFKIGLGFYYRFYEHYYDYIVNNEELIEDLYPVFATNPKAYAKNYGISINGEVLMNHIGIECNIGVNLYKPFYEIDRMEGGSYTFILYHGEYTEEVFQYGELDGDYKLKKIFSSRLGLNYYLLPTKDNPKYNLYFGASINANGGQADFSELSIGLIYRFNYKEKEG